MQRLLACLLLSGVVITVSIGCVAGTSSTPTVPLVQAAVTSPGASVATSTDSSSGSLPTSSWACTVSVNQAGTTGALNGPGQCGLGAVPMGAQACIVTPPTGSATTGWCLASASPAPAGSIATPSSQAGGVPVIGGLPPPTGFQEFIVECKGIVKRALEDPIIYPGQTGVGHMHDFEGNLAIDPSSTLQTLQASANSTCLPKGDLSSYWFPTLYSHGVPITPYLQVVYYKGGQVTDYRLVKPFPPGLRMVVGNAHATSATDPTVLAPEYLEFSCGDGTIIGTDFPAFCANAFAWRMKAPACWDGVHLDSADHKSHMAYAIQVNGVKVCPGDHPVAVPELQLKNFYRVTGNDMGLSWSAKSPACAGITTSCGGYTAHYDAFIVWDPTVLASRITNCINKGIRCNLVGAQQ